MKTRRGQSQIIVLETLLKLVKLAIILIILVAFFTIIIRIAFPKPDSIIKSFDMLKDRIDVVLSYPYDDEITESVIMEIPPLHIVLENEFKGVKYGAIAYFLYLHTAGEELLTKEDLSSILNKECIKEENCLCMFKIGSEKESFFNPGSAVLSLFLTRAELISIAKGRIPVLDYNCYIIPAIYDIQLFSPKLSEGENIKHIRLHRKGNILKIVINEEI